MMREQRRPPPPEGPRTEAVHPAIAAAGLEIQKAVRLNGAGNLFIILVNTYQGHVTEAAAYRSEDYRAFRICGERLT